jgi:hypothetical protein
MPARLKDASAANFQVFTGPNELSGTGAKMAPA